MSVEAFIFMHGAFKPPKVVTESPKQTPECYQYNLSCKNLPANTQLCAPKILGKSYHATNINDFINPLRDKWDEHKSPGQSFSDFCLSELEKFEQTQVVSMKQEIEDSDFMQFMDGGRDTVERTKRRLVLQGAIVHKTEIKWERYQCSIAEKSYYVIKNDTIENCIMFFCEHIQPDPKQQNPITMIANKTMVSVSYNSSTRHFIITFDKTKNHEFSFEDINNIVRVVVSFFTDDDFNLTLFDFACCVALFEDTCLKGLTPQLLSSVTLLNSGGSDQKLVYGTIREDRQRELELLRFRRVLSDNYDVMSPSPPPSLSPLHSPDPSLFATPSPPAHPTPLIVVNLLGGVGSFADFEPFSRFDSRRRIERSVSPQPSGVTVGANVGADVGEEVNGGSRRRRIVKKVFRTRMTRRCRRRHICTTVRSKRSNRRRGTKSKH
jgi:hypothetical protein